MPAGSPADLPETFLDADGRAKEPFERLSRPPLVEQLPRRGVALGGVPQSFPGGAPVALGEQQLGARFPHGGRPRAAHPAGRALLGPREELARTLERADARAHPGRLDVIARRAELAEPARVEERLGALD